MQNAPSVDYPVGRSASYGFAIVALGGVSGAVLACESWWTWQLSPDNSLLIRWLLGVVLWLVWGVLAFRDWAHQAPGALRWDPQAPPREFDAPPGGWIWMSSKNAGKTFDVRPELVLDGQEWILVRLQGSERAGRWVWLHGGSNPQRWDDLRRALVGVR